MRILSPSPDSAIHAAAFSVCDYIFSTYNLNGLSAYHAGAARRVGRYDRIVANIRALAAKSHVVFLQETHLNHLDHISLAHIMPGWRVFYSNKSNRSGGVAILISPAIHHHCTITQLEVDPST